jgi:GDPmannose 4,6-dehydratase
VEKEWGYAGDVAEALVTLAAQREVCEVVVGTGEAHSIGEWIERCFAHAGVSSSGRVRQREGFRSEYGRLVSNPETLRRLGWAPRVGFDQLARAMMQQALGRDAGIP